MINKRGYLIPNKDFKSFFWDYTELVRDEQYEKIAYHDWCDIRRCLEAGHDFLVRFDNDDFVEIINKERVDRDYSVMYLCDSNFGLYLYQSYQNDPCWWKEKYPLVNVTRTGPNDYLYPSDAWKREYSASFLTISDEDAKEMVEKSKNINNSNTESENKIMKNFNFDFGPVNSSRVHMSMYGIAVKNTDGVWVSYDKAGNQVMDVDVFNFDGGDFMYKVPVAIKDVAIGDVVIHQSKPMFVTAINKDKTLRVVDVVDGESKNILLTKSPFGFDFVTKVVSFIDFGNPDANNPFGNMLPLMLLADKDGSKSDNKAMMLLAMSGAFGGKMDFASNPLAMMALCGDGVDSNMMLAMMMAQNQTGACHCGCQCGTNEAAAN